MLYRSVADLDFRLIDVPPQPDPGRVLLTTPTHFDIRYVINPHMEGNIGEVDAGRALTQWKSLRAAYVALGIEVEVLQGQEDLLDMVFCANQSLPFMEPASGECGVVLSEMYAPQRRGEVAHFRDLFQRLGYRIEQVSLEKGGHFEGMGDAIWHPGRRLLWGGHGFRTSVDAYEEIVRKLRVPVLLVGLDDPDFYHLDTCFSALDEETVFIFPGAFDPEGLALVRHFFKSVIEAPEDEARSLFACNAHCPDRKHVIIQQGCEVTSGLLRDQGFEIVEVDTSEYLKAGGSVFCMKQMFW